ncbi:MAG TPA: nucleotide exchange factor GrpE, partial [Phnomibacter sp.]|nr:nucleotide exchange factor GrpE [Phnomibacter sp.]
MEQQELQNNTPMTDNNAENTATDFYNADDNVAGTNHLNESLEDAPAMQKLQDELDEQKDKYLRLFADFDNYKRRTAKERLELIQTAGREVIQSLLEVLDDCDRTEKVLETATEIDAVKEGVKLVFQKLRNTLTQRGLKPMEALQASFDADLH